MSPIVGRVNEIARPGLAGAPGADVEILLAEVGASLSAGTNLEGKTVSSSNGNLARDSVFGAAAAAMWASDDSTAICGSRESYAYGINNRGQIVGELLSDRTATRAFLFHNGLVPELGTLRTGRNSVALRINNSGQIVGSADVISSTETLQGPAPGQFYYRTNYQDHAFLYDNGRMLNPNDLVPTNSG
jgi:probable HAF family extracellular repeat protein